MWRKCHVFTRPHGVVPGSPLLSPTCCLNIIIVHRTMRGRARAPSSSHGYEGPSLPMVGNPVKQGSGSFSKVPSAWFHRELGRIYFTEQSIPPCGQRGFCTPHQSSISWETKQLFLYSLAIWVSFSLHCLLAFSPWLLHVPNEHALPPSWDGLVQGFS